MRQEHFDIVIIGAGAGGGASAWALSSYGYSVLLIEAGPFYDPRRDYFLDRPDWEQKTFPDRTKHAGRYTYGKMQELDSKRDNLSTWNHIYGKLNETSYREPNRYQHMRGVGGSTLIFSGEAHRLHPEAMKMGSKFGLASDWPMDYAELEPYYCFAERLLGVAGPSMKTPRYRSKPFPLPAHPLSYGSSKIGNACKKLGLSWVQNSVAILSEEYDGRPYCNYCGNCSRGCPRKDKGSVDVTFVRKALSCRKFVLKTDCQVTRLEAEAGDRIGRVLYVDGEGKEGSARGSIVVLSCGAIETPRLLLLSKSGKSPEGIANENGLVGKNFMETLSFTSSGLHPERLGSYRGIPSDSVCWDFNAPDGIEGLVGGCRISAAVAEAGFLGPISYARRVVDGWGREHKEAMRKTFGNILTLIAMGESLPHARSFIDLDPGETDHLGLPVARIQSYVDDMAVRRLEFMAGKVREILQASGVEEIVEEVSTYDFFNSSHVFGTCRMGEDPERSVADKFGRSHRWKNLYIADASLFPSSGGGESPSLTIEALAIRMAGHIRDRERSCEI